MRPVLIGLVFICHYLSNELKRTSLLFVEIGRMDMEGGGISVKKYIVNVLFVNGHQTEIATNTNVLKQKAKHINGGEFIITKEHNIINLLQVEKMEVLEVGRGKIGDYMRN